MYLIVEFYVDIRVVLILVFAWAFSPARSNGLRDSGAALGWGEEVRYVAV